MSFAWLFAIIVGAFILFLTVFIASKFIKTQQTEISAKGAKEIGILTNPLETGFETAKSTYFVMPVESRIYNGCESYGVFGKQIIKLSQKNFDKWSDTEIDVSFQNKYIFSDKYVFGKKFYLFSKPFEFPFKVADLIYLTSSDKKYCFLDAPEEIEDEISSINQENIRYENCTETDIKVCFSLTSAARCDIEVNYNAKYVKKRGKTVYFEGDSLMYAAIFSDNDVYECQLKRLMKRVAELSVIYADKADFISGKGCHSALKDELLSLREMALNLDSSGNLASLRNIADEIKSKNDVASCKLW